jgi:polysaccharide deacetylase family protein (PEP-CTERM system associated)
MKQISDIKNIFSVDLEDWFHILDLNDQVNKDFINKNRRQSCIEKNTIKLLELLEVNKCTATFFVLGSIAKEHSLLLRKIIANGHEIASHGYSHSLVYEQTVDEFYEDIRRTKLLLEDTIGKEVLGYRAPGFSITEKTPWAFEKIVEAGYKYDSSIFPARREHGGLLTDNLAPHLINTHKGELIEIPISINRVLGKHCYFLGGGYFRLFPYDLIKFMANAINKEKRPFVIYIHPREIDGKLPRLKMTINRYIKTYINVGEKTEYKLERILEDFQFDSCESYIKRSQDLTYNVD